MSPRRPKHHHRHRNAETKPLAAPAPAISAETPRRPKPLAPPLPPRQALPSRPPGPAGIADDILELPDAKKGFYRVANRLYVGCRPDIARFEELHRLGVRHIISLEDGWSVNHWGRKREYRLAGTRDMMVIDRPLSPFWPVRWSNVSDIISKMTDRKRQPVYVHCFYGQERALFLAGLIRVYYDGWTPERAFDEMRSFGYRPWLVPMLTHQYWHWAKSPSKRSKMRPSHAHPSSDDLRRERGFKPPDRQKTVLSRMVHRLFAHKPNT